MLNVQQVSTYLLSPNDRTIESFQKIFRKAMLSFRQILLPMSSHRMGSSVSNEELGVLMSQDV